MLNEFRNNRNYKKEDILKKHKKLPDNFDPVYEFLRKLAFKDNNVDVNKKIYGKLWIRELFMKGQSNILKLNMYFYMMLLMLMSGSFMIATAVLDWKWDDWGDGGERDTERTFKFWLFNGICFMTILQMAM